jgi:hypothetical protein
MAEGDYKLIKEGSNSVFDEKTVAAVSGKVLGFDLSKNPEMVDAGSSYNGTKVVGINPQTGTTYTLVLADAGKYIRCTNADDITVTVPFNADVAFDIGTVITLISSGAGIVTLEGDEDNPDEVVLNALDDGLSTAGQYAAIQLIKVATDTWDVIGGVA